MKDKQYDSKQESRRFKHLCEVIALIESPAEMKDFFLDLCTPAEIQAMADRWSVIEPIKEGKSYRAIHAETGVSVTTIGRVARNLTYGTGCYDKLYQKWKQAND